MLRLYRYVFVVYEPPPFARREHMARFGGRIHPWTKFAPETAVPVYAFERRGRKKTENGRPFDNRNYSVCGTARA